MKDSIINWIGLITTDRIRAVLLMITMITSFTGFGFWKNESQKVEVAIQDSTEYKQWAEVYARLYVNEKLNKCKDIDPYRFEPSDIIRMLLPPDN